MTATTSPARPVRAVVERSAATDAVLARGARWLTVGTLTVGVVNYAYALALTRLLPPNAYATFAAGQALLLTAGTVAAVSVPWVLARELGRPDSDAEHRRRAVWFAIVTNVVQGGLFGGVIGLIAASFSGAVTSWAIGLSALLIFVASTSLGWLQGARRFTAIAIRGVVEVSGKTVAGLVLVAVGAGAAGAVSAFGVGALIILIGGFWIMREDCRPTSGALGSRDLWLSTRGVAGIQGLVSILASVDVVLVAMLPVPAGAAASYQASMILARVPLFLAGAVAAVAFPLLGQAGASAAQLLQSGSRLYLVVAVPLALVLMTIPDPILALVFPDSFDQIGRVLPLTAVAGLLIGFVELLTTFFQACGQYKASMTRQAIGVVVSLVAVPVGWIQFGITGIAGAACLGAAVTVVLLLEQARRSWPRGRALRPANLLWCAGLALALLLVRHLPVVWLLISVLVLTGCAGTAFLRTDRAVVTRARHRAPRSGPGGARHRAGSGPSLAPRRMRRGGSRAHRTTPGPDGPGVPLPRPAAGARLRRRAVLWHCGTNPDGPQGRRKRVILSIYDDPHNRHYAGGGPVVVEGIVQSLVDKYDVVVITGGHRGARPVCRDGVTYLPLPLGWAGPRIGQLLYTAMLLPLAPTARYDLWIESFTPPFSSSFLPWVTRRPVIGLAQALSGQEMSRRYRSRLFVLFERKALRSYSDVVVLNQYDEARVTRSSPRSRVHRIPNVTKADPRAPAPAQFGRYALYLGRIDFHEKGLDLLLDAYRRPHESTLPLVIAGNGKTADIRAVRRALTGLADRVSWVGYVAGNEKAAVLDDCAFVVVPSRTESFCLVALEALAHGRPVIHFDLPQLAWIPPECGVKVPPFDVPRLTQAIADLSADEELRSRIGRTAQRFAEEYLSQQPAGAYRRLVDELLEPAGVREPAGPPSQAARS